MNNATDDEQDDDLSRKATSEALRAALSEDTDFLTVDERAQLEALVLRPRSKPYYEYLRGLLGWKDEFPNVDYDTPLFWKVVLLQSYRSMMWRPEYHLENGKVTNWFVAAKAAWDKSQASGLRWIGFSPKRVDPANLARLLKFAEEEF